MLLNIAKCQGCRLGSGHVFNIALKSNKNTWKSIFVETHEAQISDIAVAKKPSSPWKIIFLKEKILPAYLCRYDLQNSVRSFFFCFFFLNKCVWKLYVSLRHRKFVFPNKIINKTRSTKCQENSTQRFGKNYLANHLIKFLQDRIKPWKVGALKVCTGYHFFKRKSLVRAF